MNKMPTNLVGFTLQSISVAEQKMKFTNVLVPVTGSPLDEEAISAACLFARRDKAKLLLLHIIEVQRALPLSAESTPEIERAEKLLELAEQAANKCGVSVETDLLQARAAGPALVDESTARGVDLIVMSVLFRLKPDRLYFGATTTYVLNHAPCRVWLLRQSIPEAPPAPPAPPAGKK
jgi:nucleotide-binding universal stress UspA family protein